MFSIAVENHVSHSSTFLSIFYVKSKGIVHILFCILCSVYIADAQLLHRHSMPLFACNESTSD